MIALNKLEHRNSLNSTSLEVLTKLYAPFFPHFSEEVWHAVLGRKDSVFSQSWPEKVDIPRSAIAYPVQINGKTRKVLDVSPDENKEAIIAHARELVATLLEGKTEVKTVFVPGRIINFVVE
jgi:leucyl-tRNA synthetase